MSRPDALAGAALSSSGFITAWIGYMDILGDPVRVTSSPMSLQPSGTGDPDLDGQIFDAIDQQFITISGVKNQEGGSETVTASLSGIVGPDSDLLNLLGDESKWRGRTARLWAAIYSPDYTQQGALWNYYTGRMSALRILGSPENQTIQIDIESYLASLKAASNRTYQMQKEYDASDRIGELLIGVANGARNGVTSVRPTIQMPGGGQLTLGSRILP